MNREYSWEGLGKLSYSDKDFWLRLYWYKDLGYRYDHRVKLIEAGEIKMGKTNFKWSERKREI